MSYNIDGYKLISMIFGSPYNFKNEDRPKIAELFNVIANYKKTIDKICRNSRDAAV